MGKFIGRIRKTRLVCVILIVTGLILYSIVTLISVKTARSMTTEYVNESWDSEESAEISCYFGAGDMVDPDSVQSFRYQLTKALEQESILPANENARLYVDAYSAEGTINLKNGKNSVIADAYGVSDDFFRFHPLELISGSYFSEANIMNDYILIDQDVAWQLFGSYEVTGMIVDISGIQHTIAGVYLREEGRMYEVAGRSKASVFVSYETLDTYGSTYGINAYQIIMPNPVTGYALKKVKECAISNKEETVFIENSGRYSDWNMLKDIRNFGVSSMKMIPVRLPYWENVALAAAEKIKVMLVFRLIFLLMVFVAVIILIRDLWKHRRWRWKDIHSVADRFTENQRNKRTQKKGRKSNKWKHNLAKGESYEEL